MNAADIAEALGGGRRSSHCWVAKCPAHEDKRPSLSLKDADGRVLVKCFGGCSQEGVIAALKKRGLWPGENDNGKVYYNTPVRKPESSQKVDDEAERNRRYAVKLWRESLPAEGTPVEEYLRSRGITCATPATIRYLPNRKHKPTGTRWPCMIAAVVVWPGKTVTAVHRTYLKPDGCGKAPVDPQKMMLAPVKGGAVRLAPAGERFCVTEGIETGLSILTAMNLSVWAALSARGVESLILPALPLAREVIIAADADDSGTGLRAAVTAGNRWTIQRRQVRIAKPQSGDFNDLLVG